MTQRKDYYGCTLPVLTADQVEAAVKGELIVTWLRERLQLRLTASERAEYERAKQRGWVLRGSGHSLANAWFHWCEAVQHPYVWVKQGPKYSTVEMDLIGQHWRLTDESVRTIFDPGRDTTWGIPGRAKRGARITGGHTMILFQGIPNDRAHLAAELLVGEALRCKPGDREEGVA